MDHQERPRDKISAHSEFKVVKKTHSLRSNLESTPSFAVCEEKNLKSLEHR